MKDIAGDNVSEEPVAAVAIIVGSDGGNTTVGKRRHTSNPTVINEESKKKQDQAIGKNRPSVIVILYRFHSIPGMIH